MDEIVRTAAWPMVDHAKYGAIDTVPLSRVQKVGASFLHRNWIRIPHVFHQDEADVSALEALRKRYAAARPGEKISTLAFIARGVALTLRGHPRFNASLDLSNDALVLKRYVHIGIAIDTPAGLVLGVVRDCDRRPVAAIAGDIAALAEKANKKGLAYPDMVGGSFSLSSLGANGGTSFTPIINAPEVAILGLSRNIRRPTEGAGGAVIWRDVLPLSLSYDHRANNGADAARFMTDLRRLLEDPERLVADLAL
jgi:pyruvate dehydrogenase E2 component (dihydrolipoamide acetyltransferase)